MIKNILFIVLLSCGMPIMAHATGASPAAMGVMDYGIADVEILFDGTNLRVTNASGQNLYIYSITGVRVLSVKIDGDDKNFKLNLQRGCYIVKVGNVVRKISVK